jgi:predicted ester cyclase
MSVGEHIDIVRRWLRLADDGFKGDFTEFFSPDYRGHVSGRIHMDLMELQRLERGFSVAFSDVRRTIEDIWGIADKVVLRITTRARHVGEYQDIPATDRSVRVTGIVIYRFEGGKIAESWGELDFAGLWCQLTEKTDAAAGP